MKKIEKPNWEVRHYNELSTHELYEILKLRSEVFVVEQNCPYQDLVHATMSLDGMKKIRN